MPNTIRFLPRLASALVVTLLATSVAAPASAQAVLVGKDNWLFYAGDDMSQAGTAAMRGNIALMHDANELLKAKGIGLVVVVVPLKARFGQGNLPEGSAISAAAQPRYAGAQEQLKAASIVSVDLMPALTAVEQSGQGAFFRKDSHWTAWSAEAAAEATAGVIQQHWTLSGDAGTGKALGDWIKERRFSDFTELMTAAQRKTVGQEIYTVRKLADQGGLLDDDVPVVQVIGNSAVQPYLGFPQMLSSKLDRPVGLTWKYGNFGPWSVLLEYLESDAFAQHKPDVVVWQLNESQLLFGPDVAGQWDASALLAPAAWRNRVQAALAK